MLGMFKANVNACSHNLNLPDLNEIAKETKLVKRNSKKFCPEAFLLSLFQAVTTGQASFSMLADGLGQNRNLQSMAKQSLWERINDDALAFLLKINERLITQSLAPVRRTLENTAIKRIIIEDSTHLVLPKSNADKFPAHGNRYGDTAGVKIDLAYDLLSGSVVTHTLEAATQQDKLIGRETLAEMQKGDLILRDTGFVILDEFRYIQDTGSHWLSRLPASCHINSAQGKSLEKILHQKKKNNLIDMQILAGEAEKLPCRLIAIKATAEVKKQRQQERRQTAKAKGRKPCPNGLIRDQWHLMITSLDSEQATAQELATLYGSRWAVELQFRGLKTSLNLTKALNRKSNEFHIQALVLAAMIFHQLSTKIWNIQYTKLEKQSRTLSLEQLLKTFSSYMNSLRGSFREIEYYDPDPRHIAYGKRRRKPAINQAFIPLTCRQWLAARYPRQRSTGANSSPLSKSAASVFLTSSHQMLTPV